MTNIPDDHASGERATSHHIGVGGTPAVGGANRSDGGTDYGPAFDWGREPIKRVRLKMEAEARDRATNGKVTEEDQLEEEQYRSPVPIAPATKLDIDEAWILRYFQTGGFVVAGIRAAPGLPPGKGWQLAAADGRFLYLVNPETFAEGLEHWKNTLDLQAKNAVRNVFPAEQETLLDDPNIGPMIAMMMPPAQLVGAKGVDESEDE